MGMFAFRRMKEREAAAQVASIPVETVSYTHLTLPTNREV